MRIVSSVAKLVLSGRGRSGVRQGRPGHGRPGLGWPDPLARALAAGVAGLVANVGRRSTGGWAQCTGAGVGGWVAQCGQMSWG